MEIEKPGNQSESILKFAAAFVKAQRHIGGAAKDKVNPHFKNRYADLSSVMEACKQSLNENGIAIMQTPSPTAADGRLSLTTLLLHESGEWMSSTGEIPIGGNGPQPYGSALTYARRYFLAAMVGVCPEDDDAEGATNQQQQNAATPKPREMSDGEKFVAILADAFECAGFPAAEQSSVIAAVCRKKKVSRITDLTEVDRKSLLDSIVNGVLVPKPQPAAA